jgi:hypothetical protein
MPLDALQIGGQVKALSAHLESNRVFRQERLPLARETLGKSGHTRGTLAESARDADRATGRSRARDSGARGVHGDGD